VGRRKQGEGETARKAKGERQGARDERPTKKTKYTSYAVYLP